MVTGEYDWPDGDSGLLLSTEDPLFPQIESAATHYCNCVVPAESSQVTFSLWYQLFSYMPPDSTSNDQLKVVIQKAGGSGYYYWWEFDVDNTPPGWHHTVFDVTSLVGQEVDGIWIIFENSDDGYFSWAIVDQVSLLACR